MTSQLIATSVQVGCAALITSILSPPNNVPRQLLVAATWFLAGFFVAHIWNQ